MSQSGRDKGSQVDIFLAMSWAWIFSTLAYVCSSKVKHEQKDSSMEVSMNFNSHTRGYMMIKWWEVITVQDNTTVSIFPLQASSIAAAKADWQNVNNGVDFGLRVLLKNIFRVILCCNILATLFKARIYMNSIIHFLPLYPVRGRGGSEAYPSIMGWKRDTPWTSHQFITGLAYRDEQPFNNSHSHSHVQAI